MDWWEDGWHTAVRIDRSSALAYIEEQRPNYLLDPYLLGGSDWGREGGGGVRVTREAMG